MNHTHAGRPSKYHGGIQHTTQPKLHTHFCEVTDETLDRVWDTLTTCDCMKVKAGMRSRVAQAGRQAGRHHQQSTEHDDDDDRGEF